MNNLQTIFIGSDHAGFDLKNNIKIYLKNFNFNIIDCGCNSNNISIDYPDIALKVCTKVIKNNARAILCCGTGIGMAIAANKFNGIQAVCSTDTFSVKFSRLHNNANVLCLGGRVLGISLAQNLIEIFLNTPFEGGRHITRLNKITQFLKLK